MLLKSFIIEDELNNRNTLKSFLREFCPRVQNIGEAVTVKEAARKIQNLVPDLVFLDIELPHENGFKLLNYFPKPFFDIVFTTAYNQYAVRAFRLAAADYLLKPVDIQQLQEAVERVVLRRTEKPRLESFRLLVENLNPRSRKIALPTQSGYTFVKISKIVCCEASRSYTYVNLKNGEKLIVSKPLKWMEATLESLNFFRVSRSVLINLNYVQAYSRAHRGEVILETGVSFSVSESRREALIESITTGSKVH